MTWEQHTVAPEGNGSSRSVRLGVPRRRGERGRKAYCRAAIPRIPVEWGVYHKCESASRRVGESARRRLALGARTLSAATGWSNLPGAWYAPAPQAAPRLLRGVRGSLLRFAGKTSDDCPSSASPCTRSGAVGLPPRALAARRPTGRSWPRCIRPSASATHRWPGGWDCWTARPPDRAGRRGI